DDFADFLHIESRLIAFKGLGEDFRDLLRIDVEFRHVKALSEVPKMATWDLALGTVHEYVPETFQPAEQAPVDDLFADADDKPPENRWVDLLLKPDGTMEFLPQRFFQPTEFLGREWGEGPDLAFEFAPQLGKDLGEL